MPGIGGNFSPQQNNLPISSFGAPSNFAAGASQQASDYDTIMKQYGDFVRNALQNPVTSTNVGTTNVTPQTANYSQSPDVTASLAGLKDLSATGGYTPQGIADIRARDIAPTRGIYAQGQQELQRNRALSGGYSPNFDATQASMARDESNQIAGIDTAANAGIAQNVAANRLAAASPYAAASSTANAAQTQNNEFNANAVNATNEANAGRSLQAGTGNADRNLTAQFQNRGNILQGIQGQTNLYGTTPALTNTFGNQVMQAGQLGQGQQNIDQNKNNAIYRMGGVM
jgi:hypothetical protein